MTTWTLNQVRQAKGLRVRIEVDSVVATREGVKSAVASKMARKMINEAHAFAIEIHEDDLEVHWETAEDRPWTEIAEMRWRPRTTEVEMQGGESDGQRITIQRVGEPLRVAVHAPMDWNSLAGVPDPVTYELSGWREDERVWVYELRT